LETNFVGGAHFDSSFFQLSVGLNRFLKDITLFVSFEKLRLPAKEVRGEPLCGTELDGGEVVGGGRHFLGVGRDHLEEFLLEGSHDSVRLSCLISLESVAELVSSACQLLLPPQIHRLNLLKLLKNTGSENLVHNYLNLAEEKHKVPTHGDPVCTGHSEFEAIFACHFFLFFSLLILKMIQFDFPLRFTLNLVFDTECILEGASLTAGHEGRWDVILCMLDMRDYLLR